MGNGKKWKALNVFFAGLAFLDLCILSWYLIGIPDDHFKLLEKRVVVIGEWVVAVASYIGISKWKVKDSPEDVFNSPPIQAIIVLLTLICIFLITPIYYVHLDSIPAGADIYIAGEEGSRGKTPQNIAGLSSRMYKVHLKKDGYRDVSRVVSFMEVLKREKILVELDSQTGSLSIDSSPQGVDVFINNETESRGSTPQLIKGLPVGPYTITLKKDRYDTTVFREVMVEGEKTTILKGNMSRENQPLKDLSIFSNPPGAEIYVDNIFKGTTPQQLLLHEGTYKVTLKLNGKEKSYQVRIPQQSIISKELDE